MEIITIYGLFDPIINQCRYIGKTVQGLEQRLSQHVSCSKKQNNEKSNWIRSLLEKGLKPLIKVIERVPCNEWKCAERFWIDFFRYFGLKLTNFREGGIGDDGKPYKVQWTPETEKLLGVISDERIAQKMGVTRKAISYHRNKRQIPASWDTSQLKPPPPMGGWNKIDLPPDIIQKLGTMPDYLLAKELGLSKSFIGQTRSKLGIESYANITGNNGKFVKCQK